MWKKLVQSQYYLNYEHSDKHYDIYFTDFIKIWFFNYTEKSLINYLKAHNTGLEIDQSELLEKATEMLDNPEKLTKLRVNADGSYLNVSMIKTFGYPLNFVMKLEEGPSELFFRKVTQPLLKIVADLRSSEKELCTILKAKEEEIEEYKLLGGKIRYTISPKFCNDEHQLKHAVFKQYFNSSEISNDLLEKDVDIPVKLCMKNQESGTVHIKTEPLSQPNEQKEDIESIKTENIKTENHESQATTPKKKKRLKLSF